MVLNKELKERINQIEDPNKSLLERLLIDIEQIKYRDDVKDNLRNRIRETVAMELKQ